MTEILFIFTKEFYKTPTDSGTFNDTQSVTLLFQTYLSMNLCNKEKITDMDLKGWKPVLLTRFLSHKLPLILNLFK